jgi:hypothetical protein
MSKFYWGGGIALLIWLLPPITSTGGGLGAGTRHVDGSFYGTSAGDRSRLADVDAVVLSNLQPIMPAGTPSANKPRTRGLD